MAASPTFSIDAHAISVVGGGYQHSVLGTVFSFIKPNWVVTAKHVVEEQGLARSNLMVLIKNVWTPAEILFAHPEIDVAVLKTSVTACDYPLYPAHHRFTGSTGLVTASLMPSKSDPAKGLMIEVNHIPKFEVESRIRGLSDEETIYFPAPFAEGGNSGGPIFGAGGGVVGLVIQRYDKDGTMFARATSIAPIVARLHLTADA